MPASASGAAEAVPSTSAELADVAHPNGRPAGSSAAPSPAGSLPVVGERWRGKYDIVEQVRADTESTVWRAVCADGGQEVVLRAFRPSEPEIRAHAWDKLGGIDSPHLQAVKEAQKAGEWRVEVAAAMKGVPLDAWRAGRGELDVDTVKAIVSQLTDALAALHSFELVHLGLRTDAIFVTENGPSLRCVVGGFEAVTSFDRKDSIPAGVDPFFAPPEAIGLNVHLPGPGLCAWDWWSLGRVVQQLVAGRHITEVVAGSADPAARRKAAEALLMENDAKGPRAGAVEKMDAIDPAVRLLLRGLLTTAQDGRWTGDNVDRWIRGLPVREFYDTPSKNTHFRWRGRPYTVAEIATTLQSAEHWAENNVQLYEPTTPGTLAHFLRWSSNQAAAQEQLVSAMELADALPLKLSTPSAQRETVIMIALLQLSGGKLVWRGRSFEPQIVPAMMAELGDAEALMMLRALSTRSTALQIERVDPAAGRLLTELGRAVGDVESMLKRHGWLNATDTAAIASIFRLAVEPIPALRAVRETLAQQFAGSDNAAIEKLFKAQNVGRSDLVVLAWTANAPEKFKFYTHAEAARRRAEALRARGVELTSTLAWAQLERALRGGRLVFGGWGIFILTWSLVGASAFVLFPGPGGAPWVVAPVLVALGFRIAMASRPRKELREYLPDARWSWRDGPERCRRELRIAGRGVRCEVLETELANIKQELATLTQVQPPPSPLPVLPPFRGVRTAGMASWALLVVCVGLGGWRLQNHPVSAQELKVAWAPAKPSNPKAKPPRTTTAGNAAEDDADIKVSWPYRPGDRAEKVTVLRSEPATSDQIEYATKHGRELVAPYRPNSITTPIILPVPAGDAAAAMIFDGKRGELVNQQLYILEFRPLARSWVEVDGHRGVYLDQ